MVCDRSGVRRRTRGWRYDGVGNQREKERKRRRGKEKEEGRVIERERRDTVEKGRRQDGDV